MFIFWVIMLIIASWQVPKLFQKGNRKELIVFLLIWGLAAVYGTLVVAEVTLGSPFQLIIDFFGE